MSNRFTSWLKKVLDLIPHRVKRDPDAEPIVKVDSHYQQMILNGLGFKPVYQGTADQHAVARRRAKNKAARRSRRVNRIVSAR